MMRVFYGVHLTSGVMSAAFDLIRYIAEPDNLRFSHITLRGPYNKPLTLAQVDSLNRKKERNWQIRLAGPGDFFADGQNTVIIKVDLLDLADLFHKPDFSNGLAHLTLYDGKDRGFAGKLLALLFKYDFQECAGVSNLERLPSKAPVSGEFGVLYDQFYKAFKEHIGIEPSESYVKNLTTAEKLSCIDKILNANFRLFFENLKADADKNSPSNLSFDF